MARGVRIKGAKHTSKRQEKELIQNAIELAKEPDLLRPRCIGGCRRCHFDKTFKKIAGLSTIIDDPEKLIKAASRGSDSLVKAYAATVSLAAAGKIPYLATAKMPSGDISFAVRGKVGQDKLIGVQYFDDPDIRLLAYTDVSKRRKLRLYSLEDEVLCSDRAGIPAEYVEERIAASPYELEDGSCGHEVSGTLVLTYAGGEIRVCRDCAKDFNLFHHMIARMTSPDTLHEMNFYVIHSFHDFESPKLDDFLVDDDLREAYLKGRLSDRKLIDEVLKRRSQAMRRSGSAILIMGDKNYGKDIEAFLQDLRGSDEEKEVLRRFLENNFTAVMVKGDRCSEAISQLWEEHHEDLILAASSPEVLEEMGDVSKMNPVKAVQEAIMRQQAKGILADIPVFRNLGEVGGFADRLARAYKVGGPAAVKKVAESDTQGYRKRAVGLAFLRVAGESSNLWHYTSEEADFAVFLEDFARAMIDAKGEDYRDALANMIVASGSGEESPQS